LRRREGVGGCCGSIRKLSASSLQLSSSGCARIEQQQGGLLLLLLLLLLERRTINNNNE
jgi:hypothetical protein